MKRALLLLALLAPGLASAQAVGPRPSRMLDLTPANVFSLGSEFASMADYTGLASPIGLDYRLTPDIAFTAEFPFGYVNTTGGVSQPVVGNLALGVRGSRYEPLGETAAMRLGLGLEGRVPTAPRLTLAADDSTPNPSAGYASMLRPMSFYDTERWAPGAGAIRATGGIAFDSDPFALQLEVGGAVVLPLDNRAAQAGIHWGFSGAARAFKGFWFFVELVGAQALTGAPGDPVGDHLLAVAPGFRFELGPISPAFSVAFPIAGTSAGRSPIVFLLELAAY